MPKVHYNNKESFFFISLKKEIESYFYEKKIKKTGNWNLYSKTIWLLSSSILFYSILMFVPLSVTTEIILCALLGLTLSLIGFNVMHDACHGSYSSHFRINELLGYSLNLIGGNSFIWKQKHNVIHHTFTNIDGLDDDIARSPF